MQVPFYRHSLKSEEAEAVAQVLNSPFLTSGPVCKDVEAQISEFFEVNHTKLVSSWTNGAVATLLALDIGPGDEVIVPAMTFIATANVVEMVGAKPVFVDCSPETFLIEAQDIKKLITPKTKAIIPVHMYGQMCDIQSIKQIIPDDQKIFIIEDCAHSFESKLNNHRPGKFSDVAIFSFYATKNITCGEGGAIITNDINIYERVVQAVHHGMSASAADRFKTGKYNHWGMDYLGTKANLPDLLACLLPKQIKNVDKQLLIRQEKANFYFEKLINSKIKMPKLVSNSVHAWHLFPIGVGIKNRDEILNVLALNNIGITVNYRSVPYMKYYKDKYNIPIEEYKNSYSWGLETLSIPLYPSITNEEQQYVVDVLKNKIEPMIGN